MQGLHFSDTWNGITFSQTTTPLGLALPIYTATAIGGSGICSLPIFNPPGSNRNIELVSYDINFASGTLAFGAILLMGLPLNAVGTGALCTVASWTQPVNGRLLGGQGSQVKSNNGAGTVTVTAGTAAAPSETAPGVIRTLFDAGAQTTTTANGFGTHTYTFNGTILVPPGYMIYLASTVTQVSASLESMGVTWKEYFINLAAG